MSLSTLVIFIGLIALGLSAFMHVVMKKVKNWPMSILQNFCGTLFLVSGAVKAVDPMGTAFKMEQYFAEFEATFAGSKMSFMASLFPLLSEYSIAFSVFMIVLEMILGLMLIMGTTPKFTAWAFFIIVAFFTVLTGFTYLTGYVPPDANFFAFGQWAAYDPNNMKVTDCGCFGDFIKLEPKTSFMKDVVLLFPSLFFILRFKNMHQLFNPMLRTVSSYAFGAAVLLYCFSNYVWDIPHIDFRPFKEGVNIREQKELEEEAAANVEITHYKLKNRSTGEVVKLPLEQFLKEMSAYPKEEWEYEQVKTEPAIPSTKISEFIVNHPDGYEITDEILEYEGDAVFLVSYKMPAKAEQKTVMVKDSSWRQDTTHTVRLDGSDSMSVKAVLAGVNEVETTVTDYEWKEWYKEDFTELLPMLEKASADGMKVYLIAGGATADKVRAFQEDIPFEYPVYMADDILLKTIVRSNPGILYLKDGKILGKWHKQKLKSYDQIIDRR
jgi:hypothetical protein